MQTANSGLERNEVKHVRMYAALKARLEQAEKEWVLAETELKARSLQVQSWAGAPALAAVTVESDALLTR